MADRDLSRYTIMASYVLMVYGSAMQGRKGLFEEEVGRKSVCCWIGLLVNMKSLHRLSSPGYLRKVTWLGFVQGIRGGSHVAC